ncbi:putative clathrin assembly protein [Acorus calamus]|uniref:Clathrin assembly protein n=1 Tax=Acorus calamus TaxID=4465 RepID=A0AAV9E9V9_ACOCL|nr:putative clathrin assembly protein [Acorus calamus]
MGGSSKIRRALGAVKDHTSIGLARVSTSGGRAITELDIAIVKATRHDEHPAEERHVREILSLTCYSRVHVCQCVTFLARRLSRTRSWTVALKALSLVHRLLCEGDPSFEQEIFFATRRGTRFLNMSDFRDSSRRDASSWDFSAFVRTFALYLDERLEFRMLARRHRPNNARHHAPDDEDAAAAPPATPVRDMRNERIFARTQHLQQLLERLLACRPTGAAKGNRVVTVALYPLVKESVQIYYDLAEIMGILIGRFMEMEVPDCARVHNIFARLSKQLDDLDSFYAWCRSAAITRSSDLPDIDRIPHHKLDLIDRFIRDKSALKKSLKTDPPSPAPLEEEAPVLPVQEEGVKALPPVVEEAQSPTLAADKEVDLLDLSDSGAVSAEEHGDRLALALFNGNPAAAEPAWEAFKNEGDPSDWETALVVSASNNHHKVASVGGGGGFDSLLLDSLYQQPMQPHMANGGPGASFFMSASSIAALPNGGQTMLALPAPPTAGGGGVDPFMASMGVAPPAYVQMSEMERKQRVQNIFQWLINQPAQADSEGIMVFKSCSNFVRMEKTDEGEWIVVNRHKRGRGNGKDAREVGGAVWRAGKRII